jgi:hypothetical protein
MQIDAATATLLAAAIGALSSGVTATVILLITKRSEERRHLRELAMKAALENWHVVSEAAARAGEPRLPLDVFLVHMFKLAHSALVICRPRLWQRSYETFNGLRLLQ